MNEWIVPVKYSKYIITLSSDRNANYKWVNSFLVNRSSFPLLTTFFFVAVTVLFFGSWFQVILETKCSTKGWNDEEFGWIFILFIQQIHIIYGGPQSSNCGISLRCLVWSPACYLGTTPTPSTYSSRVPDSTQRLPLVRGEHTSPIVLIPHPSNFVFYCILIPCF